MEYLEFIWQSGYSRPREQQKATEWVQVKITHDTMASGINIYSFFQISKKIILDIRKRICDIWNTGTLISDI